MVVKRWAGRHVWSPNRSLGDYLEMTMQLSHGWLANARCDYTSADAQIHRSAYRGPHACMFWTF
jgi:hypothetical protein